MRIKDRFLHGPSVVIETAHTEFSDVSTRTAVLQLGRTAVEINAGPAEVLGTFLGMVEADLQEVVTLDTGAALHYGQVSSDLGWVYALDPDKPQFLFGYASPASGPEWLSELFTRISVERDDAGNPAVFPRGNASLATAHAPSPDCSVGARAVRPDPTGGLVGQIR